MAAIIHSDRLQNAEVWQRNRLARTLSIENIPAISAMMLAVHETEGSPASHTNVGVNPLRGLMQMYVSACVLTEAFELLTALLSSILPLISVFGGKL